MGLRDIGNRFELLNFEDAKVGPPPMRPEDRISVRAQHLRSGVTSPCGVRLQYNRFAPEEIDAPQAVLRVAEKREPGGSAPLWMVGSVVACKNSADNVLVDVNPERTRYRMEDALAAKTRIALLEADDGCSKLRRWSFWTWLRLTEEWSTA